MIGRGMWLVLVAAAAIAAVITAYHAAGQAALREGASVWATAPATTTTSRSSTTNLSRIAYQNTFDKAAGAEWSIARVSKTPKKEVAYLGPLDDRPAILTLKKLPEHKLIRVSFDLLALGCMDGDSSLWGPDRLEIDAIGGPRLMHATFSNLGESKQSYPDDIGVEAYDHLTTAMESGTLGYLVKNKDNRDLTSIYRVSLVFMHAGPELRLRFAKSAGEEETFGIDNIKVEALAEPTRLSGEDIEGHWSALGLGISDSPNNVADPGVGSKAVWKLTEAGDGCVDFISRRLLGATADKAAVDALVRKLDDDDVKVRDAASESLRKLGPSILGLLQDAAGLANSAEVKVRLGELIKSATVGGTRSGMQVRQLRAMKVLELVGSPAATKALQAAADSEDAYLAWHARSTLWRMENKAFDDCLELAAIHARQGDERSAMAVCERAKSLAGKDELLLTEIELARREAALVTQRLLELQNGRKAHTQLKEAADACKLPADKQPLLAMMRENGELLARSLMVDCGDPVAAQQVLDDSCDNELREIVALAAKLRQGKDAPAGVDLAARSDSLQQDVQVAAWLAKQKTELPTARRWCVETMTRAREDFWRREASMSAADTQLGEKLLAQEVASAKGRWVDLRPLSVLYDETLRQWVPSVTGINSPSDDAFAVLPFSLFAKPDCRLRFSFIQRSRGNTFAAGELKTHQCCAILPVGTGTARIVLGATLPFQANGGGLAYESKPVTLARESEDSSIMGKAMPPGGWQLGREYVVDISIRPVMRDGSDTKDVKIIVLVDGNECLSWQGKQGDLKIWPAWNKGGHGIIRLGSNRGSYSFRSIRLRGPAIDTLLQK